jgi:hypothetical protein
LGTVGNAECGKWVTGQLRAVLLGTVLTLAWAQGPEGGGDALAKIKLMIDRLNSEPSPAVRIAVPERLFNLIKVEVRSNADALDASVIDAIAALLADSNDVVRYWVATALGQIGPSVSRTIPALERALKEVDPLPGSGIVGPSLGSGSAIRGALQRIRGEPNRRDRKN